MKTNNQLQMMTTKKHDTTHSTTSDTVRGTTCDTAHGTTCDTVRGTTCDTAHGTTCDTVRGTTCDTVHGTTCDTVHGTTCDTVHGTTCDTVRDTTCDTVRDTTCDTVRDTTCDTVRGTTCDTVHGTTCDTVHGTTCDTVHGRDAKFCVSTTPTAAPELRFPEFHDDWQEKPLGKIIIAESETANDTNNIPLYSLTIEDGITPKTERYEREFLITKTDNKYKIVHPNCFVSNPMNLRFGAIGYNQNNFDVCVSAYYDVFKFKADEDVSFWYNYLRTNYMLKKYDGIAIGSLIEKRRVHFSTLIKLQIPIPTHSEQRKIALCLLSLDDLIKSVGDKIELLKQHKKGLMQKLFPKTHGTTCGRGHGNCNGHGRDAKFCVSTNPTIVPELRFPEFSGDWQVKRLGDVAEMFSGGTPNVNKKDYYGGDIPFIRSGEISSDKTQLFLTDFGMNNSSAKMVSKGMILYALYGATSGEVTISKIAGAINQAILAIIPNEEYDSYFICQFLKHNRNEIINKYLQGGQGNLSGKIIADLQIAFPTLAEQRKIAACLSSIDTAIEDTEKKLQMLQQHKKGLMQRMFVRRV